MNVTINPVNPSATDKKLLLMLFLQADSARRGWGTARSYDVYDNERKLIKINLTNQIIKRSSKKNNTHFRYDVIDQSLLGSGSHGSVAPILITYRVTSNKDDLAYGPKLPGSRRIVKQYLVQHESEADKEYLYGSKLDYTHFKEPIFYDGKIYMVGRRLEGKNLFAIISNDRASTPLTFAERVQISMNLIRSVQYLHDQQIIHRDIKPENIMVDEHFRVTTIDFSLAKGATEETNSYAGSPAYIAPEVVLEQVTHYACDLYSLGRVLALLWRDNSNSYRNARKNLNIALKTAKTNDYSELFYKLNLQPATEASIKYIIEMLTSYQPHERMSLSEALQGFQNALDLEQCLNQLVRESIELKADAVIGEVRNRTTALKPTHKKLIPQMLRFFSFRKNEKSVDDSDEHRNDFTNQ